jgi:hypothetical protein
LKGARLTAVGMRFDPRMPFDQWRELGFRLVTYANASTWWIGDWLVFGQAKYDRRYFRAIRATGLDYQTLRNYATVARRFDVSRRRDKLSFQHHAEVCALSDEEQDRWLDVAVARRWTRNELRRRLRAHRAAGSAADTDAVVLRITVEPERELRWREAAAHCICDFERWMERVLDEAADSVLTRPRIVERRTA